MRLCNKLTTSQLFPVPAGLFSRQHQMTAVQFNAYFMQILQGYRFLRARVLDAGYLFAWSIGYKKHFDTRFPGFANKLDRTRNRFRPVLCATVHAVPACRTTGSVQRVYP